MLKPCAAILVVVTCVGRASVGLATELPAGTFLLDRGVGFARSVSEPTEDDGEYVLIWMEAAAAVSPSLAEAHMWQYDLLSRLGRDAAAREALEAHCRAAPADLSSWLNLIELRYDAAQTAEDRLTVCESFLLTDNLPAPVQSHLHGRIAELHWNRDNEAEALLHARRAVDLYPMNMTARTLLAEMEQRADQPAGQVQALLDHISVSPQDALLMWQLALMLDGYGLGGEAAFWFRSAHKVFKREAPDAVPAALLLDQAYVALDAGRIDEAFQLAQGLRQQAPGAFEPTVLLIRSAEAAGREQLAAEERRRLEDQLRAGETAALEQRDALWCYQISRFHLELVPDVHRALRFAEQASSFAPEHPSLRQALGRAQVEAGQFAEAVVTLGPLAMTGDQEAALALGRAQVGLGEREAAIATLRAAELLRMAGSTYRAIVALLATLGEPAVGLPDPAPIRERLAQFDRRLLDFQEKADEVLEFRVRLSSGRFAYNASLTAVATLTNQGPYPITLGEDQMVNPVVLISVFDPFDDQRYPRYLDMVFDERFVIAPGESISTERRLSTSAALDLFTRQPQRAARFEFTFVLDPRRDASGWEGSVLGGMKPVRLVAAREVVDTTPKGLAELEAKRTGGSVAERIGALDTIEALFRERVLSYSGTPHNYAARNLPIEDLLEQMIASLADTDPVVRARAVLALDAAPLDAGMINVLVPHVSSRSWVVRLVVTDLFARKQGPPFLPVLDRRITDENKLVARLARLYRRVLRELSKSATAPPGS